MSETTHVDDCQSQDYRPLVLIADDNEDFLFMLTSVLEKDGRCDVRTASTGKDIIALVNELCFDALVLDVKFPDIMGTTIAELVHEGDPQVSIAFLTGYTGQATKEAIARVGGIYWPKPLESIKKFCNDLYNLALVNPCSNKERLELREYAQRRLLSKKETPKIEIPDVLLKAAEGVV